MPTSCSRSEGREGPSSGDPTSEATLTWRRGRIRGWRTLGGRRATRRAGGRG